MVFSMISIFWNKVNIEDDNINAPFQISLSLSNSNYSIVVLEMKDEAESSCSKELSIVKIRLFRNGHGYVLFFSF